MCRIIWFGVATKNIFIESFNLQRRHGGTFVDLVWFDIAWDKELQCEKKHVCKIGITHRVRIRTCIDWFYLQRRHGALLALLGLLALLA